MQIHRELTRALLTRCSEKTRRLALEFVDSDADDAVQMLAHLIDETVAMQMRIEASECESDVVSKTSPCSARQPDAQSA